MMSKTQYCPVCRGRGHIEQKKICNTCYGHGFLHDSGGFFPASSFEKLCSAGLLPEFLRSAMEVGGACAGNIQLFDATQRTLKIAAQKGFKEDFLRYFAVVRSGNSACGAALNTGTRVVVADVGSHPIFKQKESAAVMLRAGALAVQSTPLISSAGQFLGVMSTHYHQPRNLRRQELQTLDKVTERYVAMMEASLRDVATREIAGPRQSRSGAL